MTPILSPQKQVEARSGRTCAQCEYFDAEFGDCLNPGSDRFQTTAEREPCAAFYPDTTGKDES